MFGRLALLLCSALLPLIAMEVWLRTGNVWSTDTYEERDFYSAPELPGVPYTLKPSVHAHWGMGEVIANSDGIRENREFQPEHPSTFRILCIGDSITEGYGVGQADALPQQIEVLLNEWKRDPTMRFEVINAGISGFNAVDTSHFLEHLIPRFAPDLILWSIVSNDFDDSLQADSAGRLSTEDPAFVSHVDFMTHIWGLAIGVIYTDDFSLSMSPQRLDWALTNSLEPTRWQHIEKRLKRSYVYSFLKPRVELWLATRVAYEVVPDQPFILERAALIAPDGSYDMSPKLEGIYVSPFYRNRFESAIRDGVDAAEAAGIPIVIYNFDVPSLSSLDLSEAGVVVQDASEFLGEPLGEFWKKYTLGWDGHLTPEGNRRLAEALIRHLGEVGLIGVDVPGEWHRYNRDFYWGEYERARSAYIEGLRPSIDLAHFGAINQVLGGIWPPREFPVKGSSDAALILRPNGSGEFGFEGENRRGEAQQMSIWISDGTSEFEKTLTLAPGPFHERFEVPPALGDAAPGKVLDVRLRCGSCSTIRVDSIGFGQP